MTLTVEPKQVKLPRQAWLLWLASLLTAAGALAFIAATNGAEQTRSAYSQTLANNLATLSLEPFIAQDQIQLGLLCNRVASLPHVAGVTIVDLGERVLANTRTGAPLQAPLANHSGELASASVSQDNIVVGYVRVQLHANAFAVTPSWRHWLFGLLWALLIPFAIVAVRNWWQQLQANPRSKVIDVQFDDAQTNSAEQTFIISANLFNRLGLDSSAQKAAQQIALARAQQIAPLYGGTAQELDQAAVSMRFPDRGQDDAAFAALCAGMLWAECLQQPTPQDSALDPSVDQAPPVCAYRFGGHQLQSVQHSPAQAAEAEQEAQLLSAVAGNGQLAISQVMFAQIERPERLELRTAEHPLHEDLNTVGDCLYQVQGLADHYSGLLTKQMQALAAQAQPALSP